MPGVRTVENRLKPEVKAGILLGVLMLSGCSWLLLDTGRHEGAQPVPGSGDTGPTAGEFTPFVPAGLEVVGDSCKIAPMAVFPVSGVNVGVLCDTDGLDRVIANLNHDVVVIDPKPVLDLEADGWQKVPGIDRLVPMIEKAGVFVNPDGVVTIGVFSHTYFEDGQFQQGFGLLFPSIGLPDTLTMVNLPEGLLNDPSLCVLVRTGEYRCNLPVVGYNHDVEAGLVPVEAEGTPLVVEGVILKVDENGVLQQVSFEGKEYEVGGHLAAPAPVFSTPRVESSSTPALFTPDPDPNPQDELATELASDQRATPEPTATEKPTAAAPLEPSLTPTPEQQSTQFVEADGTVRPDWIPIPDSGDLIRIDYLDGHWATVSLTDCRAGRESDPRFQLDPRFVYERPYPADADNPPGVYYDCTFNQNKLTMVVIWTVK